MIMNKLILGLLLASGAVALESINTATSAKVGFNLKRGGDQEAVELAKPKKRNLQVKINHTFAEADIEVWYINQDKREDRRKCMEQQLLDLGIKPHRFVALEPEEADLQPGGKYADCLGAGYQKGKYGSIYIDATAGNGKVSTGSKVRRAIVGNTCSHKRLFKQLAESQSTAKYFLVLEDDAVLNPLKLKTALNQFVDENWGYKGKFAKDWQMVQLDFIGDFCKDHAVGKFGGKRVFKPKDIWDGAQGAQCSHYYGAQALLVQKPTLTEVVEHMDNHKVLPMDWVQGSLPRALAWRPGVARSPILKFTRKDLPKMCMKGSVAKSSISNGNGVSAKFMHKKTAAVTVEDAALDASKSQKREGSLDLTEWMDAFQTSGADEEADSIEDEESEEEA